MSVGKGMNLNLTMLLSHLVASLLAIGSDGFTAHQNREARQPKRNILDFTSLPKQQRPIYSSGSGRPTSWTRLFSTQPSQNNNNNLEIGVCSHVGADPNRPQKVNQDAYFHATFTTTRKGGEGGDNSDDAVPFCSNISIMGVLDGHGLKGHIVSEFLAKQLPLHFQKHVEDLLEEKAIQGVEMTSLSSSALVTTARIEVEDLEVEVSVEEFEEKLKELSGLSSEELDYRNKPLLHQAIIRSFHSVHWAAMQNKDIPAGRNGATCVMAVLDHTNNTLHIGHVGDSRAIHIRVVNSSAERSKKEVTPLTRETTVKIQSEKERVEKGEGSVRGNNVFYGPVGIAMTRSLGNGVMLRAGVVPTPILETYPLRSSENDLYLVLGTDGIWDVLTNDAVAALVVEDKNNNNCFHDVQSLCESIAAQARKKWVGDLPIVDEEKVDDITCMVVRTT